MFFLHILFLGISWLFALEATPALQCSRLNPCPRTNAVRVFNEKFLFQKQQIPPKLKHEEPIYQWRLAGPDHERLWRSHRIMLIREQMSDSLGEVKKQSGWPLDWLFHSDSHQDDAIYRVYSCPEHALRLYQQQKMKETGFFELSIAWLQAHCTWTGQHSIYKRFIDPSEYRPASKGVNRVGFQIFADMLDPRKLQGEQSVLEDAQDLMHALLDRSASSIQVLADSFILVATTLQIQPERFGGDTRRRRVERVVAMSPPVRYRFEAVDSRYTDNLDGGYYPENRWYFSFKHSLLHDNMEGTFWLEQAEKAERQRFQTEGQQDVEGQMEAAETVLMDSMLWQDRSVLEGMSKPSRRLKIVAHCVRLRATYAKPPWSRQRQTRREWRHLYATILRHVEHVCGQFMNRVRPRETSFKYD